MRPVPRGRFVRWSGRGQGFPVVIVEGKHLFPFRTQQLSPLTPMVLPWRRGGRAGNRRVLFFRRFFRTRSRHASGLRVRGLRGCTVDSCTGGRRLNCERPSTPR